MKQVKQGLVPKLRFKEFEKDGEWEEKKVEELFNLQDGYAFSSNEFIDNPINSFQVIRITDINNHNKNRDKIYIPIHFEGESEFKKYIAKKGDLLLSLTGAAGFNFFIWNSNPAIINQRTMKISLKDESNNALKVLLSPLIYDKINAHGSGQNNNLSKESLRGVNFLIPKPAEQQKIADCLSSLDELIEAEDQKLEALQRHKKGLMQELFPADGETLPRLRFPEFQSAPEWEELPVKKVFSIFQGFAFSSNSSTGNGVKWLKIADVSIQKMNHSNLSYLPIEYKKKYEKFLVKKGDYVIALTRPILSKQLKMAQVDEAFNDALLNQRVGKIESNQHIHFVYFLLQTSKLIDDIEKSISGSEPPNLSAQQIEEIKTCIPSKDEQQRIADFLTSVDDLITSQIKKLESLRLHKKGLMQQLFPNVSEAENHNINTNNQNQ